MSDAGLAYLASPDVLARARKIKLFLMDVDGTLTDGGVCLSSATIADGLGEPIVSETKSVQLPGRPGIIPCPHHGDSDRLHHRPTLTGRG